MQIIKNKFKKMKRERRKQWFELRAYSNGFDLLRLDKASGRWEDSPCPNFSERTIYAVNDDLSEFRTAEKEGKQIQCLRKSGLWCNVYMNDFEPSDNSKLKFRIVNKVDFSILNDEDVFYIKTIEEREFIFKGEHPFSGYVWGLVYSKDKELTTFFNMICDRRNVAELREATKTEKLLFYSSYPEFRPVQVGDIVKFWNYKKEDFMIGILTDIDNDTVESYPYAANGIGYRNAEPINREKTINQIFNKQ